MALTYFDEDYKLTKRMREENRIPELAEIGLPWLDIKGALNDCSEQRLIPFFGAGASLLSSSDETKRKPVVPSEEQLNRICEGFHIEAPQSKSFLCACIQLASLMDSMYREKPQARPAGDLNSSRAPSAWELANMLTEKINEKARLLEPFKQYADTLRELLADGSTNIDCLQVVKDVAHLMNLHQSIPQLLETASLYGEKEGNKRRELIALLKTRFANVKDATNIQREFAKIAGSFVGKRNNGEFRDKEDYIIITTNYDELIEKQLTELNVPWCVIHVREDACIMSHVPLETKKFLRIEDDKEFEGLRSKYQPSVGHPASRFNPDKKKYSLAMVYKIHGAPVIPPGRDADNVVISDGDYINFIQKNSLGNALIPAYVNKKFGGARLLFLGYSFSDWNVRALYEHLTRSRAVDRFDRASGAKDYVVMQKYRESDALYFNRWGKVSLLISDLDLFASKLA